MSVTITICTKCDSPCSRAWYDDCDLVPYGDRLVPMHQEHEGSNCCHAPCTEVDPDDVSPAHRDHIARCLAPRGRF